MKWSARWLALSGIVVAIGCRSTPEAPVITTPLLPETVIPGPPPLVPGISSAPAPMPPMIVAGPNKPVIVPPGAQLPKPGELAQPRLLNGTPTQPPAREATPLLTSNTKPTDPAKEVEALPAPAIKPLLIEAPRPPAGPDGFAPAPIIPPPTPAETFPPPRIITNPAATALPLKPGEKFAHAPDYRWIAGTLDRHTKGGYWTLRYADYATDDMWGGKMRLLDDPRLNAFKDGDSLFIEGELLAPRSAAPLEGSAFPPYRINELRPINGSK